MKIDGGDNRFRDFRMAVVVGKHVASSDALGDVNIVNPIDVISQSPSVQIGESGSSQGAAGYGSENRIKQQDPVLVIS